MIFRYGSHSFRWLVVLMGLLSLPARSMDLAPLQTRNESLLSRSSLLVPAAGPQILENGKSRLSLRWDWTSEYHTESVGSDLEPATYRAVLLDGETQSLVLQWQRGLPHGWEISASLPWSHEGGGVLDASIESWHKIFGLPNGGRQFSPHGAYRMAILRNQVFLLDLDQSGSGLGDIQLGLGHALGATTALRILGQLATGDADSLRGGREGIGLELDHGHHFSDTPRLWLLTSAGVSWAKAAGPLQPFQNQWVGFGGLGLLVQWRPRFQALAQLQAHTPLYDDADFDVLSDGGLQLSLGGRWAWKPDLQLEFGFQEDLITGTSPDFSLHSALRWTP